jgi:cell division septation protein DedD
MADASRLGGLVDESATPRYTIVIGAFRERSNAQKLAAQAQAAGFPAQLMECKRGMIAVGVCPSDRIARTFEDLTKLRKEAFCPKDSWILLNE